MLDGGSDKKFLIGFLAGVGLGIAAALLIVPQSRSRLRSSLVDGAKDVSDRMKSIGCGHNTFRERQAQRARRKLIKRIDRIRSAGF